MIPEEVISAIRERVDIVELASQYMSLKRVGASHVGLCPFHSEKTPSFNVHRGRRFYHCFGCHASGDVISLTMALEGQSFPEAVRALAERAGIELPSIDAAEEVATRRRRARRERLYALMEMAAAFFAERRQSLPHEHVAREELRRRGIDEEMAAAFRLGYAPDAWDELAEFLRRKGQSPAEAEEVGLLVRRRAGPGYYDRFRNRLLFPICDLHGRVIAFSGRALPSPSGDPAQQEPKYLNSPESDLFRKGSGLFGLHQARVAMRRGGEAVLCEGNFDLMALHQAGFSNVVAPLGTAFTRMQAEQLRRFVSRVVLLFDGDEAGRKAVVAAFPRLAEAGLSARVAQLPEGHDPDSYLQARGAEDLRNLIDRAPAIVEHLIDEAAANALGAPDRITAAIRELGPVIAAVDSQVERHKYIERVAQRFEVSDLRAIRNELLRGARAQGRGNQSTARGRDAARASGPSPGQPMDLPKRECDILGVFLDIPELFAGPESENVEELLTNRELRAIFQRAASLVQETGVVDASRLLSELGSSPARGWLENRLSVQEYDCEAAARDALGAAIPLLARENTERELVLLARKISDARRAGEDQRALALTRERQELERRAHHLVQGLKR